MRIVTLGDYVHIQTGKLDANAANEGGLYPFFTCSREVLAINHYAYDKECLLVAGNGDLNVKYYSGKFNAYQRTYIIESKNKMELDTKYLYYFMNQYLEKLRNLSIGGVIKYIKLQNLTDISIPLPGLDEQRMIVALLDKAQALIDKRKQAITKLDELVQAVFLDMFGDPISNERSWELRQFNKIIQDIESGWSPVCKTTQANRDEWGVLKLSAITSGSFKASENKAISESTIPKPSLEVRVNDLLFVRKNTLDLVGTCAYVFETPSKLMLPDTIFRFVLREDSNMNKLFLWQLFNYPKYKKQIQKLAGGTAGSMPNISKSKLLNFEVIYPDPELQSKFSEIVHKIELQKRKQFHSLQQLESNFQALLQKAFKGELKVKDGVAV